MANPIIIVAALTLVWVILYQFVQYSLIQGRSIKFNNQSEKLVVVTGANSGLGYYSSLSLAKDGASVVLACRNTKKGEDAKSKILVEYPKAIVYVMELDLSSFKSIRNFAKEFKEKFSKIDILINNAGIMALPTREVTKDGLEAQIGTNHFGHFLLTALLYPIFANNGRIINHSSAAHYQSKGFPFDDVNAEKSYFPFVVYGHSKLANLLFTFELNNRLSKSNPKNITSVAVHPGYTSTNLQSDRFPLWEYANNLVAMSGEDGSISQTFAAIGDNVQPSQGDFIGPQYYLWGKPVIQKTSGASMDVEQQKQLWDLSEKICGIEFSV
eukprot:gene12967-17388_t